MTKRYAKLTEIVLELLLAFPNSYMAEAGFSQIDASLTKQRSRLDVGERRDLRLRLTNRHELVKSHQLHHSH